LLILVIGFEEFEEFEEFDIFDFGLDEFNCEMIVSFNISNSSKVKKIQANAILRLHLWQNSRNFY